MSRTAQQRFEDKYWACPMSGCWIWMGAATRYGVFNAQGRGGTVDGAHRFSWESANGPVPSGMCVLHRCDVPLCVNPTHLFIGTQIENLQDMTRKGRRREGRGERHGKAKLTSQKANEIRALTMVGRTHRSLAAEYGVSYGVIGQIVRKKIWKQQDNGDQQ